MPKIINNIREKLLAEAKKQVFENGYSAMTIRSVASACKVGVGTVYNYFPSKDMLVASFMLTDWQICLHHIEESCQNDNEIESILRCIYQELKAFEHKYINLFHDENAEVSFAGAFSHRHKMLREQIARPLLSVCIKQKNTNAEFLAQFVAENMLTWTFSTYTFEEIKDTLLHLF